MLGAGRARSFARLAYGLVRCFGIWEGLRTVLSALPTLARRKELVIKLDGKKIYLRIGTSDTYVFMDVFLNKQYDFRKFQQSEAIFEAYSEMCKNARKPVVLDCGANIGLSSLWLARQLPSAAIYAIEPSSTNFERLKLNTKDAPAVVPVNAAVWSHSGELVGTGSDEHSVAYNVSENRRDHFCDGGGELVKCLSINDLIKAERIEQLLVVKIDIEGSEGVVFEKNTEWLDKTHLVMIELHDWMLPWAGTSHSVLNAMLQRGFDFAVHRDMLFCFQRSPRSLASSH